MEDKEKEIEVREFILEDDMGSVIGDLSLISFVNRPAIQQNYKLFSDGTYTFAKTDKEKMIVTGPAMRADMKILRQDEKTGDYFYGVFSKDQIKRASEIYLKNSNHTKTNIEHGALAGPNEIEGVYVAESWIVEDPKNDKASALGFQEVNKGDWYISYRIENKGFWQFLKETEGGFSIEGMFLERFAENFSSIVNPTEMQKMSKIAIILHSDLTDKQKEEAIEMIVFNKESWTQVK